MPKARKKKNSSFQTTITKSVFLYGRPNKEKLAVLRQMQNSYTALINRDIELLEKNPDIVLQLVKNDKKDSQMRKLVKNQKGAVQDCAVVLFGVCEECLKKQAAQ